MKKQTHPITYQTIAVGISVLLTLIKFIAWNKTNSNAILTDALENIINVVAGCLGLYSLWLSSRPKDENHPYGHGKIEFISTGFEGGLIFLAGILIIGKAINNLFFPTELSRLQLGIFLVAISGVVNFLTGYFLLQKGKKQNILVLQSEGKHLLSDAYSSVGLVVGLYLVYLTGIIWLDHVLAIFFGAIILYTGFRLLRTAIAGIMDEADYALISTMVKALEDNRSPNWIDVHNFRVIKYGNAYHVDCHLTLPWYFNIQQSYHEVQQFEKVLMEHNGFVEECFIHVDPCGPPSACLICQKTDCDERKVNSEKYIKWKLSNVMKDQKHDLD